MPLSLVRYAKALGAAGLVLALLAVFAPYAGATAVTGDPNPPWPGRCGVDAALLIDHSNSIMRDNAANPGLMKDAAKAFADALAGTPSRLAVNSFWKTAQPEIGLTDTDAAGVTAVKAAIDSIPFSTSSSNGSTNWDEGFRSVEALGAEVLIVLTDGNPTVYLNNYGSGGSTDQADIDEGVRSANRVKSSGLDSVASRIVAVGIGGGVSVANLKLISGTTANDDYFTTDFANLENRLVEIASKLCGGSLTVQKLVQQANGSYAAASGWGFETSIGGGSPPVVTADPADGRTNGTGLVNFNWPSTDPEVATVVEEARTGYTLQSAACEENGDPFPTSAVTRGVRLTLGPTDVVNCVFRNARDTGSMRITKQLRDAQGSVIVPDQASDTDGASFLVFKDANANGTYQAGEAAKIWPTNTDATCTISGGAGFCDVGPLATGTYGIHETAAPQGSTTGPDVFPVVVTKSQTVAVTFVNTLSPIGVTIDKLGPERAHRGDTVHYTFTIRTAGPKLHDIAVAEVGTDRCDSAMSGPVKTGGDADAFLEIGEAWTYACDHLVTGTDPDPLPNEAKVTGTDDFGRQVTDNDTHGIDVLGPAIALDKKVEGADHKPVGNALTAHAGDVLHYTVAVTNVGDTSLVISSLADSLNGSVPALCTSGIGSTLPIGGTITCAYTAIAGSDVQNVASVIGIDVLGSERGTVTASDQTFVHVIEPAIRVVKNGPATAQQGDVTEYSFEVTNTGDVALTNVSVDDDVLGHIGDIASLPAGSSQTLTKNSTAPADDVRNVATACGTDPLNANVCDDDDHFLDVSHPTIEVVKTGTARAHQGDATTYSFQVTNTGDVALTNVSVDDNVLGHIGNIATLLAGESTTLQFDSVAPADDVTNVATACGSGALDRRICDDDDHHLDVIHPAIEVVKSGNTATAHEGDVTTYSFEVTNTGDVTLTNVTVDDDVLGEIGSIASLEPGQSQTLTKDSTAPPTDVRNVARVCGDDPLERNVCDDDDHDLDVIHPGLNVTKTAASRAHEGDDVTYTFGVTNTGDVPLTAVAVVDNVLGSIGTIPSLGVGATIQLQKVFRVPASISDVVNVVTACGVGPIDAAAFCDTDEHHLDVIHPGLTLDKKLAGGDHKPVADALLVHVDDDLGYTLVITNTGDTALRITELEDSLEADLSDDCSMGIGGTLAVGSFITCAYSIPAAGDEVHNVATVIAVDELGGTAGTRTASDETFADVLDPAIEVVKSGAALAHVGDEITYTFKVTNTGGVVLTDLTVTDDVLGDIGTIDSLEPGESKTLSQEFVVPEGAGEIVNVGTACGVDAAELKVCDDDTHKSVVITPDIEVLKSATPVSVEPGQTTTYTYVVTNTGDTELTEVTVTDDILGDIGTIDSLAPGETKTLTRVVTVQADSPRTNIATACGVDGLGTQVCATAKATIAIVLPLGPQGRPPVLPSTGFRVTLWVAVATTLVAAGLTMVQTQRLRRV